MMAGALIAGYHTLVIAASRSSSLTPKPVVTAIICTFRRPHLLGSAIESVLEQTMADFELIVVDDGSTDETTEVARSFPAVRYVRQENRGVSAARNRGVADAVPVMA